MFFAAVTLATATASPTPPPEPNHLTIEGIASVLKTSGQGWNDAHGTSVAASGRYEFQTTPRLRFANTFHWERVSSTWNGTYDGGSFDTWFDYTEYDDELDVEVGRPDYPTGLGLGYFDYTPIHDGTNAYNLTGLGVGIDRWPNYYVPRSYYGSLWYYPSVRGTLTENGTYGILRADIGVNFRFNLTRPWNIRIGFANDSWFARNAYASDTGFTGPYIALSYWR